MSEAAWVAAVGRLVVAASRQVVHAVVRATPQVEAVTVQASTVIAFGSTEEKHSYDYNKQIVILKEQKTRQLG